MKLVKCSNKHFYDGDKFKTCPHCGREAKKAKVEDMPTMPLDVSDETDITIPLEEELTVALDVSDDIPYETNIDPKLSFMQNPVTENPITESVVVDFSEFRYSQPNGVLEDPQTVGYYDVDSGTDPVVGWLVCIEGSALGTGYNLKSGRNFIGRSFSNDVVLKGDVSVSREQHAIVIYEPKGRIFLVQPGMSRELFYINDEVVLQPMQINDRDIISVGNNKLMFVALCGSEFSWDDYIK